MSRKRYKNGSFRLFVWDDGDGIMARIQLSGGKDSRGRAESVHKCELCDLGRELYERVNNYRARAADAGQGKEMKGE